MILLIDKPKWYTSFDIIRKLQKLYPKESIGHAGTLDPMATGLLIVAIGKDTKKLWTFLEEDKSYIATIDFAQMSDTWDMEFRKEHTVLKHSLPGEEVQGLYNSTWERVSAPLLEDIQKHMDSIIGTHMLPLTPFSAKKIWGKKLYEYAREWNPIFIDTPMTILSYEVLSYTFPLLTLRLDVGSGTYIRSIAHRLWSQMWCWGILTQLRRTRIWKRVLL